MRKQAEWCILVFRENTALFLNGLNDAVILPTTTDFHFEDSLSIDVWIRILESRSGVSPIVCTVNSSALCIFLNNG